jgi:hypothetical protein
MAIAAFATCFAFTARASAEEPSPCPPSCAPATKATTTTATTALPDVAAQPEGAARPSTPLQVAGPPLTPEPPRSEPPRPRQPPYLRQRDSDGAGPRLTFGRTFTQGLNQGFYGRFETEYFEVKKASIVGALLGLEGWGTAGATAGGGAIPISIFAGARGGPFTGPKAPLLFLTLGLGVDLVVYDRVGTSDGFGLFSPFGVATAGIEIAPGVRLLADSRAIYRWHWTSRSEGQIQLGLTLGLNSYLWDGP